jgi:hypothetical protein
MPFRSLLSTETSEDTDPAAQRYSSVLLIVVFMGCGLDELGSNSGRGNKMSTWWLPVFLYRRRGNEHRPLYSTEVKKEWSRTYTSLTSLHCVYKDTFTSTFTCAFTFNCVADNDAVSMSDFMASCQ